MKYVGILLFVCSFVFCQESHPDAITAKAIEGARLLHDQMRDPDSFGVNKAWIMHSEKYGDAICFEYQSRNGFGGMNQGVADYAPHTRKDRAQGKYILDAEADSSFEFHARCGDHAAKHDTLLKDVTQEVRAALKSGHDDNPKNPKNDSTQR